MTAETTEDEWGDGIPFGLPPLTMQAAVRLMRALRAGEPDVEADDALEAA